MSALSANLGAVMAALDEIQRGTLDRFLTLRDCRGAGGLRGIAVLVVASVLLGTIFGALSNALGMLVRERESIIGINTFLPLPLTFLHSAFMAPSQMPAWMRHIADFGVRARAR